MIAISIRFPAGRFHATPWGRHVNEGAVEWPPSPWRILRAMIATWKRKLPDLSQEDVEPLLRTLARTLPLFHLPPASTGHTRHFMPWFKKGPDDRTLVFDTFVVVARESPVVVLWPDDTLTARPREILDAILRNLNTLGRAESWCEAWVTDDEAVAIASPTNAQPLSDDGPGADEEIVRLLCPDPVDAFADDYVAQAGPTGRSRTMQATGIRTPLYDPAWNICMETLQLHKERWSDPPGSRWVRYTRPRNCFTIEATHRRLAPARQKSRPQVVRFALDSKVLPLVTETLPVAEAVRRALMCLHGRRTERAGVRGRSDVLSGKNDAGTPLQGHGHAFYLPTDEDRDGRLDHITLVARDEFGLEEMHAIHGLREIRPRGRDNVSDPLRVLLLGYGRLDESQAPPLRPSRLWNSATPYIAARHAKTRGRHRIDLQHWQSRVEFLSSDLRVQLAAIRPDLRDLLDQAIIAPEARDGHFLIAGRWRPIQFKLHRAKPDHAANERLAGAFRIGFPEKVSGLIGAGYGAHFGMGLFLPCE